MHLGPRRYIQAVVRRYENTYLKLYKSHAVNRLYILRHIKAMDRLAMGLQ